MSLADVDRGGDTVEALRARLADAERARDEALAANEAKTAFLAQISHEIRTQLAGIMGMTQVTLETKLTAEQREYLELVHSSAEALLTLVNDLLDLSKAEQDRLEIESMTFDVRDLLRDTVRSFAPLADAKDVSLDLDVKPEVPERVIGDPGRIRQVLSNLLGNAVKFTSEGRVGVSVDVETPGEGDRAVLILDVEDTGIGIANEDLDRIFDPYARVAANGTPGTGLGLSIVRRLVEAMSGSIEVASTPGRGSRFRVKLPVEVEAEAPRGRGEREVPSVPVLVVGDNLIDRRRLRSAVAAAGTEVTVVAGSSEAIEELERASSADQPYAAVVYDLDRVEDRFSLAQRLRDHHAFENVHIVILTSAGERGDAARCRELRIAGYLSKPLPDGDVAAAVGAVLRGPAPPDLTRLVTKHWLRERRRRLSILVVDDSPTHRLVAGRILEARGHTVVTAGSGAEAIEIVDRDRIDVILLDLWMPGMDGFETAAAIRERLGADTPPMVAMTGETIADLRARTAAVGIVEVVRKPLDAHVLARAIERAAASDPIAAGA